MTPQRANALKKANAIRSAHAEFQKEVRALDYGEGIAVLAEVLERGEMPGELGYMRLDYFLRAPKHSGPDNVTRIRQRAHVDRVNEGQRAVQLRHLEPGERGRLAKVLRSISDKEAPAEMVKELAA